VVSEEEMMDKFFCETCRFWIEDIHTKSTIPGDNYRCYNHAMMNKFKLASPAITGKCYGCEDWEAKDLERCEKCGLINCMCEFFRPEHPFFANPPKVEEFKIVPGSETFRINPGKDLNAAYETDSRDLIVPYFTEVDEEIQVTQETQLKVLGNIMINGTLVTEQDVIYALEKLGIDPIRFQSAFADFLGILEEKLK
jgi:hypothetical protein